MRGNPLKGNDLDYSNDRERCEHFLSPPGGPKIHEERTTPSRGGAAADSGADLVFEGATAAVGRRSARLQSAAGMSGRALHDRGGGLISKRSGSRKGSANGVHRSRPEWGADANRTTTHRRMAGATGSIADSA